LDANGGDPSGWATPLWSAQASLDIMDMCGTRTSILSVTAPGAAILPDGEGSRKLARQCNEESAKLRDENPSRFGFFATLPSLTDKEGALKELKYAMENLKADGVTLFTRYGEGEHKYLGHPDFKFIWQELDKRKAVVFVHPTHPVDTTLVNKYLPLPALDYPHETCRAVFDMITTNRKREFPNCKVILSHAGGTLPFLLSRISVGLCLVPNFPKTGEEIIEDFNSFYFDLALSSSEMFLDLLLKYVPHDHILFGSDFPYAPAAGVVTFASKFEEYKMDVDIRTKINYENALLLFPRLRQRRQTVLYTLIVIAIFFLFAPCPVFTF